LKTVAAFDAYGDTGFVAGVIKVDTTAGSALPPTYSALNVVPDFNCIRLSHRASGWVAMVTPLAPAGPPCPPNPAAPTLTAVPVHNTGYPGFTDVPAVARFHEGRSGANIRVPFFGLKCADAWCMVIPTGVDTTAMPQAGAGGGRGFSVHGWSDAQHLGVPDPTTQVVHASTLALASVMPDEQLGDYTIPANFSKDWVHVATVLMAGDPNSTTYGSKWHFRPGKNEIYIRTDPTAASGWTGEVRNAKYFLGFPYRKYRYTVVVNRTDHAGMHIPGTARFWWYEQDEGLWVRCDEGCCQVAPS
jgi:hypothetical protein